MQNYALAIGSIAWLACSGEAAAFEFKLPTTPSPGLEGHTVDLGVRFSAIESLELIVSGEYQPGVAEFPPGIGYPDSDAEVLAAWWLSLGEDAGESAIMSEFLDLPADGGSFAQQLDLLVGESDAPSPYTTDRPAMPEDFDFLIDGVFYTSTVFFTSWNGQIVQYPVIQIDEISLRIVGTTTPEPQGIALLLPIVLSVFSLFPIRSRASIGKTWQ